MELSEQTAEILSEQTVEILSESNLSNVLERLSVYPQKALYGHPKASNGDSKLSDIRSKLSNEKKKVIGFVLLYISIQYTVFR